MMSLLEKEVAWNGIRFLSPVAWEIGKIGNQYLMLENDGIPVMEVKWRRIRGSFSPQTQLQRLVTHHKKKIDTSITKITVPAAWKKGLRHYQSVCFCWQTEKTKGMGIILYCPECQTSTLMQFFLQKGRCNENIAAQLLATFQDHPNNGQVTWTAFGMTATIPFEFKLLRFRFEPGLQELTFTRGKHKMTLYRWGPASVLLREMNLSQIAGRMFGISRENLHRKRIEDHDVVDAMLNPGSDVWAFIKRLVGSNHGYCVSRLWHIEDKNRLLGVKIIGNRPIDIQRFEQVCHHFDSL